MRLLAVLEAHRAVNPAEPLTHELAEAALLQETLRGVLDCHPDPLYVVDLQRRIRFCNLTGTRLLAVTGGFRRVGDRLSTGLGHSDRKLDELLLAIRDADSPNRMRARGLRLHRRGAGAGWLVVIHPLRFKGTSATGKPLFLVHAASRLHPRGTLDPLLTDLFGLSTAERGAALAVIRTGSVDTAASSLSVSRETIRTQLKAVFRKCDIRSTLQLGALIRSVALFCGADRGWNESPPFSPPRVMSSDNASLTVAAGSNKK